MDRPEPKFSSEAEMCQNFMSALPEGWIAYPETGGFDILLVRKEDGTQVGIEAKLKLNAKVIAQAAPDWSIWRIEHPAPDFRAVLVPNYVSGELSAICGLIGIQIIRVHHRDHWQCQRYGKEPVVRFTPDLPSLKYNHNEMCGEQWFDFCPAKRLTLPDYIPDTGAGNPSPLQLSHWKIKAIKIVVILQKEGFVNSADFKKHQISMSRWTQGGMTAWLRPGKERGQWVASDRVPDFRTQHPVNFVEIEKSYEDWK